MNETPKSIDDSDKPLKFEENNNQKVDINVLKARAKAIQDKENLRSLFLIIFFLSILGTVGIYFSI